MNRITIGNKLGKSRITIGEGQPTRINLIIGTNTNKSDSVKKEIEKIDLGARMNVDTITDLSMVRLKTPLWKYVKNKYPHIAVGMNPPYLPYVENNGRILVNKLEKEIHDFVIGGGDFMTMNFVPKTVVQLKKYMAKRSLPITSRQGGLLADYMIEENQDNPYYKILNSILPLLKKYRITVNIGSTFRPAGIADALDETHRWEVNQQMKIFSLLQKYKIQSIVEIMSHQPLNKIGSEIVRIRKKHKQFVPFQLLGPIVTDIGSGKYDYITSLIGAAEAARYNPGKITMIPAYEHIGFPNIEDIEVGLATTKLAIHAGDLTRIPSLMAMDKEILRLRSKYRSCNPYLEKAGCNKCKQYCPLILTNLS